MFGASGWERRVLSGVAVMYLITGVSSAQPSYVITDLGAIGGTYSHAEAINEAGQIGGDAQNPGTSKPLAFRTDTAGPIDGASDMLGTLGGSYSVTLGLNNLGQAVGYSGVPGDQSYRAFLTPPEGKVNPVSGDLGTLSGRSGSYSQAYDINDSGVVVGVSDTTNKVFYPAHPFRTKPNSAINPMTDDLGTLGGGYGEARGINNTGIVVGFAELSGSASYHAFRTAPNSAINPATDDLGTMGGSSSIARSINEVGWSAGSSQIGGNAWRAFLLPPGEILDVNRDDLGTLGGDSHAIDLNADLVVVGVSRLADNSTRHAFVFDGQAMYDLNALIPAESGWVLNEANDINDDGLIVGTGTLSGQERGFLLVPAGPATVIPADLDKDGDVDAADFDLFEGCASGPLIPAQAGCLVADFDGDDDVDQDDFGYFQECYSGAGLPVPDTCVQVME